MLRTPLSSLGARGAMPLRASLRSSRPLRSLAQRQRPYTTPRASKPSTTAFTLPSHKLSATSNPSSILNRLRTLRFFHNSRRTRNGKPPSPNPTPHLGSPGAAAEAAEAEPQSLGAKMRRLSREYGWSAVGVYLTLSALDFPLCYLLVRTLGTDRIGEWEHIIISNIKKAIPESVKQKWTEWRESMKKAELEVVGSDNASETAEMAGWGVEEADAKNKSQASLATQLALAYAIHKSFIFLRVPLTAAVTPKVVKVLRGWGWDIGKRTTKEMKAAKRASLPPKKPRARFVARRTKPKEP